MVLLRILNLVKITAQVISLSLPVLPLDFWSQTPLAKGLIREENCYVHCDVSLLQVM